MKAHFFYEQKRRHSIRSGFPTDRLLFLPTIDGFSGVVGSCPPPPKKKPPTITQKNVLHKNKDFELNKTKNLNIIPGGFAPLPLTILHLAHWRYAPPRSPSHVNFQYPHRTNSENPPTLPNLMFSGCGWVVCLPTDPIFPCSFMIRDATSGICYPQLVLF